MKLIRPDAYLHIGWFPLPEVTQVCISGAPDFLQGKKLLFISDVHLRSCVTDQKLDVLMDMIEMQQADLILLGGDYAEEAEQCARFFRALSKVHVPMGIYAVAGNNDRECFSDIEMLRALMAERGVRLLLNEEIRLGRLAIGGCDEHKYGNPQTTNLLSGGDYRILLSHFPVKPECSFDLMLSGHTHGGQFNVFGLTPYIIAFERRYKIAGIGGLHTLENGRLLVSKGIGVSRLPLRIGVHPQMQLVKFTG